MVALGEQVQVHVAQLRAKAVRVFGDLLAAGPADVQQIGLRIIQVRREQSRNCTLHHFSQHAPIIARQHPCIQGIGQEGADKHTALAIAMGAEYCKRIGVFGAGQGIQVPLPKAAVFTRGCIHL